MGREYSLATGGFREADFQWPLSGYEFEERIDETRPTTDVGPSPTWPSDSRVQWSFTRGS